MPQFGASLTDNSRVVIYDRNVFIIQASGANVKKHFYSFMSWDVNPGSYCGFIYSLSHDHSATVDLKTFFKALFMNVCI
jgi:hypothetical protein